MSSDLMRRIVYNPAATTGGALSVLNRFYHEALNDSSCKSIFITSVVSFDENENVQNIQLPWVKKSWIHRLYCDCIYMPLMIKRLKADEVLSLQNIAVPFCRVKQTVYVHNAIPFTDYKFKFSKDSFLWFYQNVIGRLTISSLRKVDNIIVQTEWMKLSVAEKCRVPENIIAVERVQVEEAYDYSRDDSEGIVFFYPATPLSFKNHQIVIDAAKLLKAEGVTDYRIVFTLDSNERGLANELYIQSCKCGLPIEFVGYLNRDILNQYYCKSVLIFPSYLETVGLPLLEAKQYNCYIIAADCSYAHDAISDYENCSFFKYNDVNSLFSIMKNVCNRIYRNDKD